MAAGVGMVAGENVHSPVVEEALVVDEALAADSNFVAEAAFVRTTEAKAENDSGEGETGTAGAASMGADGVDTTARPTITATAAMVTRRIPVATMTTGDTGMRTPAATPPGVTETGQSR